jgi:hypothetical protein
MNVIDRIKQLLSGDGDEKAKINVLAERRALLAQRRDRIYGDIGKLEKKEAQMLEEGKAAKSSVPRRRLAAQLAQLRKDIGRQNASAAMLNQQINIISTDIHNLTLIQQGEMAKLPDTTELTEHAVAAEEMLETLKADSDLVSSLEQGMEESLASEEELAILKEFEQTDEPVSGRVPEADASGRIARQADSFSAPPEATTDDPFRAPADPPPIREPTKPTRDGEAEAS